MLIKIWNKIKYRNIRRKFQNFGSNSYIGNFSEVRGAQYISIGANFHCGRFVTLEAWDSYQGEKYQPEIIIGDDVTFTEFIHVSCINRIEIGEGCLIGRNVLISDNNHGDCTINESDVLPIKRNLSSKGGITIGKNVWIGKNVCILSGVQIGDGAVIAANAVVTHDVEQNSVVGGIPARLIKIIT